MKPIVLKYYRPLMLWIILPCMAYHAHAQDTIRLSLSAAEGMFMKQNLSVLAEFARVDAGQANEIQAKLYPNPVVNATVNLRDPENNKWLHLGRGGQSTFEIEQLILLGGKRKAALVLTQSNTALARSNLEALIRNLLHELRITVYETASLKQYIKLYSSQLEQLKLLAGQVKVQVEKKNLPMKDLVRIRSTLMQLDNERNEALAGLAERAAKLRLLLASDVPVSIEPGALIAHLPVLATVSDSLYQHALTGRPELRIYETGRRTALANLDHEKKQAVPDLTAMANYDRFSGAFRNEFNAGVSMPIPLFHRNQGNIKSARHQVKEADYNLLLEKQRVLREVDQALANWMNRKSAWERVQDIPRDSFSDMLESATVNYRNGNLSLIEFMDLYESATEAFEAAINVELQLILAAEELNFKTASSIFIHGA